MFFFHKLCDKTFFAKPKKKEIAIVSCEISMLYRTFVIMSSRGVEWGGEGGGIESINDQTSIV